MEAKQISRRLDEAYMRMRKTDDTFELLVCHHGDLKHGESVRCWPLLCPSDITVPTVPDRFFLLSWITFATFFLVPEFVN